MRESLNFSEADKEDMRSGQQMMKSTFEKMKDDELNFRSLKDDDMFFINNSMDVVVQQSSGKLNHPNSNNNICTPNKSNHNFFNDKNMESNQINKSADLLSPTLSIQLVASNQGVSVQNHDSMNYSNLNSNINASNYMQQHSPKKIRYSRDNKPNNFVSSSGSKKLFCDTNFRKSIEEYGNEEIQTKSGISFLNFGPCLLKNDSTPQYLENNCQKLKQQSKYSYIFRVLQFASKLIYRSSSIRFKKLTINQFNLIDDLTSDYEKDLFVMLMFQLSRNQSQNNVMRYFDYIIFIKYGDIPSKIGEIENKLQISKSKLNWIKLIKLEILVLLIAHVASCIFLRIGLSELEENTESWLAKFQFTEIPITQKYILSLYYIVITMTTIGYGDIAPVTFYEKGFIVIVALIATNVCAYSFSQISEIVKYEQMVKSNFDNMMQGINMEMNKRGLNILLQHKVRKYFEFQHYQNQQKQHASSNLIDNLPTQMKEEVLYEVNQDVIKQIHIFQQLSLECQKQISLSVKQKIVYPEEIVFRQKELNNCIYYVVQGAINLQVEINTKYKHKGTNLAKTLITLKKKEVFGYEGFLFSKQSPYSAQSNDISVLSYIEKEDFIKILNHFPSDFEKFMYVKDRAMFGKQTSQLNLLCFSCNQTNHNLWNCPIVNPQIQMRKVNEKKEIILERQKLVRKRVSYYKPLKDKFEITKQAQAVMLAQNEESFQSDIISLNNDETSSQDEDHSQVDEQEEYSSDVLDEEEENRIESLKQMRYSKHSSLQRSQKSISLKEIKNIISLRNSSDENILSLNNTSSTPTQNDLTPLNFNQSTLRKLKSNELYVIEENEEDTPIIPFSKNLIKNLDESINNNQKKPNNQENQITIKTQQTNEDNMDATREQEESRQLKENIEEEKINNVTEQTPSNRFCNGNQITSNEMILNTSFNSIGNQATQQHVIPQLSNFRPVLPKDSESYEPSSLRQITNKKFLSSSSINNQQKQEVQNEGDSTSLDQKINIIQQNSQNTDQDLDKNNVSSNSTKYISVPRINLIEMNGEEEENSKDMSNENLKEPISSRRGSNKQIKKKSDTPPHNQSLQPKKKKREQEFSWRVNRSSTISLRQISSLDDIPLCTPTNSHRKRELKKKSSLEYGPDYQQQLHSDSQTKNCHNKPTSQSKIRQKSHSQIIEAEALAKQFIPIILNQPQKSITNLDKICIQTGQGKHKKTLQVIPNNNRKKSEASIVCIVNPNSLNNDIVVQERQCVRDIHDLHQTTTEFQIRCETNLQDLNMLIVRKKFMLEQQKGYLQNFILVEDNEMDIDQMQEFQEYYPLDNAKEVLKRIRKAFKKTSKVKSPIRITSKIRQKRQSKQSDIISKLHRNTNTKNTIGVQSTSMERFSFKI